jgi:tRNA-binding protein
LADDLGPAPSHTSIEVFDQIDMRVGRIVSCSPLTGARKPAYKLEIDFGPLGIRSSSAQLTTLYEAEDLLGRLVVAVVNFPPRMVAGFSSEVLVLGVPAQGQARHGHVVLLEPEREVDLGARVF